MNDKFRAYLRVRGYSVTPQRLAIFWYLQRHDPSPARTLIEANSSMDRASVYRTLALFKALGIAHESIVGGRKVVELTDTFDSHHHHITCVRCGRSVSAADDALEARLSELAGSYGFTPLSHQIEVSGICSACAAATPKPDRGH